MDKHSNKRAVAALRECETPDQAKEIFELFHIGTFEEKIGLIREAMGGGYVYYSGKMSEDDQIDREIFILLDGEWKANELYTLPQ